MCGLFGWYNMGEGFTTEERKDVFNNIARKSQSRGKDSFGIFYINSKGKPVLRRFPFMMYTAWREKVKQSELEEIMASPILIGHTRMASRGELSLRNTHPFPIKEWICAHNGTIQNSFSLMGINIKLMAQGETDSEEAFCYLIENGITKENLEEIYGSVAFIMYNIETKELYLIADDGSNIHFIKYHKGVIWQSTELVTTSLTKRLKLEKRFWLKEDIYKCSGGDHECIEFATKKQHSLVTGNSSSGDNLNTDWEKNFHSGGYGV